MRHKDARTIASRRAAAIIAVGAVAALVLVSSLARQKTVAQEADEDGAFCPESASPISHASGDLAGFAEVHGAGVASVDGGVALRRSAAEFQALAPELEDIDVLAAADFFGDGFPDLVVEGSVSGTIDLYRNVTADSPEPADWSDPNAVRAPGFEHAGVLLDPGGAAGHAQIVTGDFNQDGNADFFYYRNEGPDHSSLDVQHIYLGNGDGTFQPPYDATADGDAFGYVTHAASNAVVADVNDNGWPDIVFAAKLGTADDTGAVIAFLNDCPDVATSPPTPCSSAPRFAPRVLLSGLDFGSAGPGAIAFADVTNNGFGDVLVGSASHDGLRLYPGLPGGGFEADYQSLDTGAVTVLLAGDFTLDGRTDLVVGPGGLTAHLALLANDGTSTPFSGGSAEPLALSVPTTGPLSAVALDYDGDPDGTLDVAVTDGTGTFSLVANRTGSSHVSCGEVASGPLAIGSLEDEEMVITSARLVPSISLPEGTSARFFLANQDPPNWTETSPCIGASDQHCVSFDEPTGNELQYKAVLCSDDSGNRTPTLQGAELRYDYQVASVHYRAGIVVRDGVAYAAGFSHPGSRGRLFALDAALTTTFWDAGEILDEMDDSARNVYTASADGRTAIPFHTSHAGDEQLVATLRVADDSRARDVIDWARSPRFGPAGDRLLGSIETSTPAVLSPPSRPVWYPTLDEEAREEVDAFIRDHRNRPTLVLAGSKSGMLHAVRSIPGAITSEQSGREAWAFLPSTVASRMDADRTRDRVTAHPDGSPTLADIRGPGGDMMTIAVINGGYGLEGAFALDVTDTIDTETGEVRGPEPLWQAIPGGSEAGYARTSPVVIRSEIDGAERFVAVLGSGPAHSDPDPPYTRGRDVLAVDAATGEELWRFRAACSLSSDIAAFEERDPEPDPEEEPITGFLDRVTFADACGNVYLLDPGVDLGGGYADSSALGRVSTGAVDPNGESVLALFSTSATPGALGGERPIAGTIAARPDITGRTVLFFGTGGFASADPGLKNAFYAVYADDGDIRDVLEGECFEEGCEKFYGGVVVGGSQVFLVRAVDPPAGSGRCGSAQSRFEALDLNTLGVGFSVELEGRPTGPLFGHAGAVYLTTDSGDVTRVGKPSTPSPVQDGGEGDEQDTANEPISTEVMAWRRLL